MLTDVSTNAQTDLQVTVTVIDNLPAKRGIAPGRRDDMPPADGSSTVAKIAADLRPSTDGSSVCTSLVAGGG